MFNINFFKKRINISFYKYLICMCLVISGVYIASYGYNIDFSYSKQVGGYLTNTLIKVALVIFVNKYLCTGIFKYFTATVVLIYSGICLGTFLMFTLYSFPLYKFLLTVLPCAFKSTGLILLFSPCFEFDKFQTKSVNVYIGATICFVGELLLWLL